MARKTISGYNSHKSDIFQQQLHQQNYQQHFYVPSGFNGFGY